MMVGFGARNAGDGLMLLLNMKSMHAEPVLRLLSATIVFASQDRTPMEAILLPVPER